jgi:hypothetical protein
VESLNSFSDGVPRLLWEGPGVALGDVPPEAYKRQGPGSSQ